MIFETRAESTTGLSVQNTSWWERLLESWGYESDSGIKVTESVAMAVSVVFRCRTLVASIGTLPLKYYQRLPGGGKEPDDTDPLSAVLHDQVNAEHTSIEHWEMAFGHLAFRYNAYSQIIRDQNDRVKELWALDPTKVTVGRVGGRKVYSYRKNGQDVPLRANEVLHMRGMMTDGLVGVSPFSLSRNAVGLRASQEKFSGKMFANGAKLPFVYVYPGRFRTNKAREELEKSLQEAFSGLDNAGKTPVLEEGLDVKTIGMSAEDAEAIAQAKFSVAEIARFYGVPMHKLNELDRATFSNIEEQNTDWVVDTVRPWAKRVEAAIKRDLIPQAQKSTHFAEFLIDDLLRGNTEDRWNAYSVAFQTGTMSINDIRQRENLNPIDGGDQHLVPLNMVTLEQAGQNIKSDDAPPARVEQRSEQRSVQERMRIRASYTGLLRDAYRRIVNTEVKDIRKNLSKLDQRNEQAFIEWVEAMYAALKTHARQTLTPVVMSYAQAVTDSVNRDIGSDVTVPEGDVQAIAGSLARRHVELDREDILDLVGSENARQAIEEKLSDWEENRAEFRANDAAVDSGEATARLAYLAAGVFHLRWVTVGDNCPLCNQIRGRTSGFGAPFVDKGQKIVAEGVAPYVPRTNIKSPPLHSGCDCMLLPGL